MRGRSINASSSVAYGALFQDADATYADRSVRLCCAVTIQVGALLKAM